MSEGQIRTVLGRKFKVKLRLLVQVINFENFFIFDFLNHADSNGIWDCYPQTHGLVRNSKMGPDQSLQDSQVFQELIPDVV